MIILVITIIILAILAAAVILSLNNENPIDEAAEVAFKNEYRELERSLASSLTAQLQKNPNFNEYDVSASNLADIRVYIPEFSSKHVNVYEIRNGKLVYIGVEPDELTWIHELGGDSTDTLPVLPPVDGGEGDGNLPSLSTSVDIDSGNNGTPPDYPVDSSKVVKPSNFIVVNTYTTEVEVSWKAEDKYDLYLFYVDGKYIDTKVSKYVVSAKVRNLIANTIYGFKVVGVKNGYASNPISLNIRTKKIV
ncbi:MAG: hypothetical protein RSC09_05340 [Clostridia bacterium]